MESKTTSRTGETIDIRALLGRPLVVVSMGLAGFARSLEAQEVPVIQLDWRPPASGKKDLIELLDNLR